MSEYGELLHPDDFMPGTYKLIIEYVGGKCKMGTKEMIQGIVEQSVHLKEGVLIFKGFDVGSILFIYQISEAIKNYLLQYKFTKQDIKFLEENNITSLIVDGVTITLSSSQSDEIISSATCVASFPENEFQILIKAVYDGDIASIQKLLKVSHISLNGEVYSKSGSSLNLIKTATIAQQIDIVKLLLTDYSMDPYVMSKSDKASFPYVEYIFHYAPQSFIIEIIKYRGVKRDFKTVDDYYLLHIAVVFNCFDVVSFLLEECSGIDVNATDGNYSFTPLHLAYIYGHTQIAEYLIKHGADANAVDINGHTPHEHSDAHPEHIKTSKYSQNKRKIHDIPYSIEHCYFMKLISIEIDEKEAVSLQ